MAIVQSTYTEHLTKTLHKLVFNRQTGLMSIEHIGVRKRERGEIYFETGEIVLARTDNERGVTALARIQDWQQAYYIFHEDATIPLQIMRSTHQVSIIALPKVRRIGTHTSPLLPSPPAKSTWPLPPVHATPLPQSIAAPIDALDAAPPGRNAVFRARLSKATPSTMKRLERRERIVFALLDGQRSVQHIARLTHLAEVVVARILVQLLQQGYIEYIQG
jgi:Domain of unknown function (DUF4388)